MFKCVLFRCNTRDSGGCDIRSDKMTTDALMASGDQLCDKLEGNIISETIPETDSGSVSDRDRIQHCDNSDVRLMHNDTTKLHTIEEICDTQKYKVNQDLNINKLNINKLNINKLNINKLNEQLVSTEEHIMDNSKESKSGSVLTNSATSGFNSYESSIVNTISEDVVDPANYISENHMVKHGGHCESDNCCVTHDVEEDTSSILSTNTVPGSTTLEDGSDEPQYTQAMVHPSDTLRRAMNLKRIPSLRRRYSNPSMGQFTANKGALINEKGCRFSGDVMSMYTTHHNAIGYATLRELQRHRTHSLECDSRQKQQHIKRFTSMYDDNFSNKKTMSLDFRRSFKR